MTKLATITDSKLFTKGEQITMLVLPNIEAMMCGVACIHISHPRYMLEYTDRTAEEAVCPDLDYEEESSFAMVGTIQDSARKHRGRWTTKFNVPN